MKRTLAEGGKPQLHRIIRAMSPGIVWFAAPTLSCAYFEVILIAFAAEASACATARNPTNRLSARGNFSDPLLPLPRGKRYDMKLITLVCDKTMQVQVWLSAYRSATNADLCLDWKINERFMFRIHAITPCKQAFADSRYTRGPYERACCNCTS